MAANPGVVTEAILPRNEVEHAGAPVHAEVRELCGRWKPASIRIKPPQLVPNAVALIMFSCIGPCN